MMPAHALCTPDGPMEGTMIDPDDLPRPPRRRIEPLLLDPLGLEELHAYIAELQTEIARAEAAITAKQGHRSAADAFFRKPG
jgi:uncharacterized small protein (DUF1192 family)